MIELIEFYRPEIISIDEDYNGGPISNYRYYLNFPLQYFDTISQDKLLDKPYRFLKLYVRNNTLHALKDIRFYILPITPNFEYYDKKYQFYLKLGSSEEEVEKDLDKNNLFGIFDLYNTTIYNGQFIYLKYPKREDNLKNLKKLENITFIIYDKITNSPVHENIFLDSIEGNINGNHIIVCKTKFPIDNSYGPDNYKICIGESLPTLEIKKYVPIWLGIEYYDLVSKYLTEMLLVITYNMKITNIEVV